VGVRNGISENQNVVKEGYQRVLAARLADAAFFYREDLKTPLEKKAAGLKAVMFQKELGSVWEKAERTASLAAFLAKDLGLPDSVRDEAQAAARLGKADLVSAMVGEFPELQGVMGRIYGGKEGLPDGLCRAIEQHYWPLTADGALPETDAAALAALADKLDVLAGDFLIGLIPTGSQDPYGLRRAAVGVLRILEARGWDVGLKDAVSAAMNAFPAGVKGDREAAAGTLLNFFRQRWSSLLETEGFRVDEIAAVVGDFDDPVDARRRFKALHDVRRHPDFEPLAVAFKRAANILKQAEKKGVTLPPGLRPEAMVEPAEKALNEALQSLWTRLNPFPAGPRRRILRRGHGHGPRACRPRQPPVPPGPGGGPLPPHRGPLPAAGHARRREVAAVLSFLVCLLVAYIIYLHAKFVRRGLPAAENPVFVMEKPELPRKLQAVSDRIDQWKEEGRIDRAEHEKLAQLVREDAERA
jgi:glycyl-tRNA synthetase beta chain